MKTARPPSRRHSMHEFGTVCGVTREVRVNRLENRLAPLVPFPHRHDFYHMVVITSGSGWHEIDFQRYPIKAPQVFFIKPDQVHSWRLDPSTTGYVLEFGHEAAPDIIMSRAAAWHPTKLSDHYAPERVLTSPEWPRIASLLQQMLEEYEGQALDFEVSLWHSLIPLLIKLSRLAGESSNAVHRSEDLLLQRFYQLLESHFRKEHEVNFYAKRLKTTAKALTMRISRSLAKSARAVIQDRVMLEAMRLLAYSNLQVAAVGYDLGFEDPNYFSRFFRRASGQTPGDFRAQVSTDITTCDGHIRSRR